MDGFSQGELLRIKEDIEKTPPYGIFDINEDEFGWTYKRGEHLVQVERCDKHFSKFMQAFSSSFVPATEIYGDAIAFVHNHPGDILIPSANDISSLLGIISKNEKIYMGLIAQTENGTVKGFYEYKFEGMKKNAYFLFKTTEKYINERRYERLNKMENDPVFRAGMTLGQSIFSVEEWTQMVFETMNIGKIIGREIPVEGYVLKGWNFVKNVDS